MRKKQYYGKGLPTIDTSALRGTLIVIEGADGSGRSTQSALLRDWLGQLGYPTTEVGLKRSELVGPELEEAMRGNVLHPLTLGLFYATDFADQLEHGIIPALRAGFIVVADRYIYTLMVRDIARGADPAWIKAVYGIALVPDLIFYLNVTPKVLAERSLQKKGSLTYWESGMDIERSGDLYHCFLRYQTRVRRELGRISAEYGFCEVDGDRDALSIHTDIRERVKLTLKSRSRAKETAGGRTPNTNTARKLGVRAGNSRE